jgi:hypothetical protein
MVLRCLVRVKTLSLVQEIEDFALAGPPINETLVRDLIDGNFLAYQRNVAPAGGTSVGKSHPRRCAGLDPWRRAWPVENRA